MKKLMSVLLAVAMVLSLAACGKTEEPRSENDTKAPEKTQGTEMHEGETNTDDKAAALGIPGTVKLQNTDVLKGKKIGCSICYKGDEWCSGLAAGLEALAKYYGAELACEDGDLNDETQTKQIENMIANGVDMIMVDPITPDGSDVALSKAYDAKIPIIVYDGYWTSGEQKAVTTVTWNQKGTGTMVGEYFVKYVKENMGGKCRVIELSNAVSTHCQERFVGLHEVIDAANQDGCQIEIVNTYDSQGNRETAYNAISAVVEPYDFVISDVDNGAMGAVSALQAVGNTDVKVLSMGAYGQEPFGALYENDPNYLACLNVDAWVLAQYIFDGAIAHFNGEDVAPRSEIELFMVDNSNVTDFWKFD